MWRIGSPLQISNDVNPSEYLVGVDPDRDFLVDGLDAFLVDENNDKLTAPKE